MTRDTARGRNVIVVGARISGAATAWALAPHTESVLMLERSERDVFWPQQAAWDRSGALLWEDLGLLDTVLGCGAPRLTGHVLRSGDAEATYAYPQDDEHCYRMTVARERLDPALVRAALSRPNVTLVRGAKVVGTLSEAGRVIGVEYRHRGRILRAHTDLVVLADGRMSRTAENLGTPVYQKHPSPWLSLLYYSRDLGLHPGRGYHSRQPGTMVVVLPCAPDAWCVAGSVHQRFVESNGLSPVNAFRHVVENDPLVGHAVRSAGRISPIGGAGKLRLQRRPMAGPGWCLVGDSGYYLDPLTALGTKAALTSVRLLRDRVADTGDLRSPTLHAGLTEQRDAELEAGWQRTAGAVDAYDIPSTQLARTRQHATDTNAASAAMRAQMGLTSPPRVSPVHSGTR